MVRPLRRSIAYLTATRLVVNTTFRFVFPFLPAIARGLGVSLERAGLLLSARSLSGIATPLVVATVGRGERRVRLAGWSLGLFAAGAAVTAATGVYGGAVAGFVLIGLGKPGFDTAAQAYVADRTPYERRARYLSVLELTWATALLAGAPAAGWLISRFGWRAPFWWIAALVAAAALASPLLLDRDRPHAAPSASRTRLGRPALRLLGVVALFSLSAETTFVVFGAWLEDRFALSLTALGVTSLIVGLAELSGEASVLAFGDRFGKRRMVAAGLCGSAIGYLVLGAVGGSLAPGVAALSLTFVAFEVTIVSAIPLATEIVPGARTRYLALLMVAISIGRAAGDAIGPALFRWHGLAANTTMSAVVTAMALFGLVRWTDPEKRVTSPVITPRRIG
ncbi:MAG TPA: MFS transporter [Acidimicrobiia bacterium]